MNPVPVILDVDTGIDDAFSILLAASRPELRIIGLAAVDGNVPLYHTYRNTCYLRDLLGLDVPVARGCAQPLIPQPRDARHAHGDHGLGNLLDVPDRTERRPPSLFDFYRALLTGSPEPVTIIANGPLTNLAVLLLACPELRERIARIVFMGGGLRGGNATAAAEFNIYKDPEAARIVLNSGLSLVMAGLDITHTALVSPADLESLGGLQGEAQAFFRGLLDYYLDFYTRRTGRLTGAAMHDSVTVAYAARPELFTWTDLRVQVDTGSGPGRGATIADTSPGMGPGPCLDMPPNVRMLRTLDHDAFLDMTLRSITGLRDRG